MLDTRRIRTDFPILARKENGRRLVYLDNAATSQKPRRVIDAIVREPVGGAHRDWAGAINATGDARDLAIEGESLGAPSLDNDLDDAEWTSEIETGSDDDALRFGKRVVRFGSRQCVQCPHGSARDSPKWAQSAATWQPGCSASATTWASRAISCCSRFTQRAYSDSASAVISGGDFSRRYRFRTPATSTLSQPFSSR